MIIISFVRVAILGAQYNDSHSWATSQTAFGPPRATSAYIASAKKNVKISLSVYLHVLHLLQRSWLLIKSTQLKNLAINYMCSKINKNPQNLV